MTECSLVKNQLKDYILIERVWQDEFFYQVRITCASPLVVATNKVYVQDDTIEALCKGLNDFTEGKTKEFFWSAGETGDLYTEATTFRFIPKDKVGHVFVEVYMEIDDLGKFSKHHCCFYVDTDMGLLEKFCKKLPTLNQNSLGIAVLLNDMSDF